MIQVPIVSTYNAKGVNQATKSLSKFDKSITKLGKSFAGLFAAQKLLSFGKASVKAYAADDKAARLLANTLKNVGAAYASTNVEDYIANLQKQTGVLDDFLRPALQTLLVATGDVSKSQTALGLALDISANGVISLETATKALAKGFQGNTTALGKMGGAVSKATLATGDMNKITAELTQKYKGSALIAMTGYAGQMAKLGVTSQNVKEIIGKGLLDALSSMSSNGGIDSATKDMEDFATQTADAIRGIGILSGKLKNMTGLSISDFLFKYNLLNVALMPFAAIGKSKVKTGYGQQSPGDRNTAVAANKKLLLQKQQELALLTAKNKTTKEEAQMKADQAALDKLKAKFDLERIGLNAALNNATDEETKARIRAQIAILDETGKTAQAANDALVKAQADKLANEVYAADVLKYLAAQATSASVGIIKWLSALEYSRERFGNASAAPILPSAAPVMPGTAPVMPGTAPTAPITAPIAPITATSTTAIAAVIAATDAAVAFIESDTIGSIAAIPAIIDAIGSTASDFVDAKNATQAAADAIDAQATSVSAIIDALAATIPGETYAAIVDSINSIDIAEALATYIGSDKATKDNAVTITINDNTSGLIAVVADAVLTNNRYGNSLVPTGTIAG